MTAAVTPEPQVVVMGWCRSTFLASEEFAAVLRWVLGGHLD